MKKFFLPLFLGIFLTICSCQKEKNLFTLTGEIQGLGDSIVMLYGIFSVPDSIIEIPVEDGKFSCQLPLDTITPMYMLLESSQMEYPIFADKGVKIHVKGDTSQLHRLTIMGGEAQEEYNTFRNGISHLESFVDIRQEADSFIVKHPQSIVSIYLIQRYFVQVPSPNSDLIKTMIKQLSGNMHDNHYISRLQNTLSNQTNKEKILQISALPDTTGTVINTSEYKNKFTVLSLWASWHPESIEMQDSLQTAIEALADRPVKFVSLSLDSDREAWLSVVREKQLGGVHLCDFRGWDTSLAKQTNTQDIPALYIANTSGKIIATNIWGVQLEKFLEKQLDNWEKEQKKKEQEKKKEKIKNRK
ncbi:MAG: AhpC/TSA family protein [Bacteroidaceae bacterium]|nr:AhpC/TSA family protein [Bacteroidaceae bacterium]